MTGQMQVWKKKSFAGIFLLINREGYHLKMLNRRALIRFRPEILLDEKELLT